MRSPHYRGGSVLAVLCPILDLSRSDIADELGEDYRVARRLRRFVAMSLFPLAELGEGCD
jgi:hypothetical protein